MTPQEAIAEFKSFTKEIGPKADIGISLNLDGFPDRGVFLISIWADGLLAGATFRLTADTLDELLLKARAKWAEFKAEHRVSRIREMALEIIRITAEHGVCTDAALRAGKFSDAEVTDLGPDACTDATEIASNGPFSITPLAKANAA